MVVASVIRLVVLRWLHRGEASHRGHSLCRNISSVVAHRDSVEHEEECHTVEFLRRGVEFSVVHREVVVVAEHCNER